MLVFLEHTLWNDPGSLEPDPMNPLYEIPLSGKIRQYWASEFEQVPAKLVLITDEQHVTCNV